MRDQGRVLNHGHRSRVGRRGGGVWWVLQQEEGLSNNRPRGTWKGVDQYFSCYLLTIIWPAAPNTPTQKGMQARAFSGFSAHLFHSEYAANSLYLASADASMLQTQSFIYQLSGYQLSTKSQLFSCKLSQLLHTSVTFKSMLCANVAPPDHPDLPVSDDFYKI